MPRRTLISAFKAFTSLQVRIVPIEFSRWRFLLAAALLAGLAGCSNLPPYYSRLNEQTQTPLADPGSEQVFFATDRKIVSGQFTGEPGPVTYGDCTVKAPVINDIGHGAVLERLSQDFSNIKVGDFNFGHVNHSGLTSCSDMITAAHAQAAFASGKDLLIFVHGWTTSFPDAVTIVGELDNDLGQSMTPIAFSWDTQPFLYTEDEDNAEVAAIDLAAFLDCLIRDAHVAPGRIHLVCLSLGARVVTAALLEMSSESDPAVSPVPGKQLADLVFAAPDVNRTVFINRLETRHVARMARRTTIYCNCEDRAMFLSEIFHGGDTPRAGDAGANTVVLPDAETVDVSLHSLSFDGHLYLIDDRLVIDDLYMLLVLGQPASRRNLYHASKDHLRYWLLRP